jgi:hypothetical protein
MSQKINRSDNKNTRRAKKSFNNKQKRKNKTKSTHENPIVNEYTTLYSSEIQHFYDSNRKIKKSSKNKEIELDDDFSLFDNPDKVLRSLINILHQARINHTYVSLKFKNKISFGALYFIDTMCWQIAKKKRWGLKHNLPKEAYNLLTNLQSIQSNTTDTKESYIINNRIKINRVEDALARQVHKEKSKEIRDLIRKGIREIHDEDYQLSHEENTAIDSAISEHFDNILLHVPDADYGYLCGYFDRINKTVTILIYNFGCTIAHTLSKDNLPSHIKISVEQVIANFTKHRLLWSDFTKENALTLLALQEGISSKLDADISRGHGIMDFIEHCVELNEESQIVIISGKTAIKINSKYKISEVDAFGRKRRIIAFNEKNDIFTKPDKENVVNLDVNFPGVIIETTIPLKV